MLVLGNYLCSLVNCSRMGFQTTSYVLLQVLQSCQCWGSAVPAVEGSPI